MKLFRNYTLSWWQAGMLKLCMLLFGVAIGAYWWDFFLDYITTLVIVGAVLGFYLVYALFRE